MTELCSDIYVYTLLSLANARLNWSQAFSVFLMFLKEHKTYTGKGSFSDFWFCVLAMST